MITIHVDRLALKLELFTILNKLVHRREWLLQLKMSHSTKCVPYFAPCMLILCFTLSFLVVYMHVHVHKYIFISACRWMLCQGEHSTCLLWSSRSCRRQILHWLRSDLCVAPNSHRSQSHTSISVKGYCFSDGSRGGVTQIRQWNSWCYPCSAEGQYYSLHMRCHLQHI